MDEVPKNCDKRPSSDTIQLCTLAPDTIDFAFISATRFFFLAYAGNDHAAWMSAILGAPDFFPQGDSNEAMRRTLLIVHEMRIARRSNFHFSNPRCPCCSAEATKDERYLLQMVQAARAGQVSNVASNALMLCEGSDTRGIIEAASFFAEMFPLRAFTVA